MDDKQFRKHLADLAHGHHHPEEHDWAEGSAPADAAAPKTTHKAATAETTAKPKTAKKAARKK